MRSIVTVKDLYFGYKGATLLKGLSFSLEKGKVLVISGLSGQGKSTLLRLLIGLERPSFGAINIFDQDVLRMNEPEFNTLKSRIGFVFQNAALISTHTVEANLRLPLVYHNLANEEEIKKRIENTLEMLLIKEYRSKFPAELSLGLQKRTAMARAIITNPELILMDEPTYGLDSISRSLLLALIGNIRVLNNVSMIIITNDLQAARELESDIGIIKDGELIEPMSYQQLKNSPDTFLQTLFKENST